ncbi:unnamed protein product [Coccothraustes coccothraustes]
MGWGNDDDDDDSRDDDDDSRDGDDDSSDDDDDDDKNNNKASNYLIIEMKREAKEKERNFSAPAAALSYPPFHGEVAETLDHDLANSA